MTMKQLILCAVGVVVSIGTAISEPISEVAPYCGELKRLTALSTTQERFASITGKQREGNFTETSLPLSGWKDCSLYGTPSYTCDTPHVRTASEAETIQASIVRQTIACHGNTWMEDKARASSVYVVLQHEHTSIIEIETHDLRICQSGKF